MRLYQKIRKSPKDSTEITNLFKAKINYNFTFRNSNQIVLLLTNEEGESTEGWMYFYDFMQIQKNNGISGDSLVDPVVLVKTSDGGYRYKAVSTASEEYKKMKEAEELRASNKHIPYRQLVPGYKYLTKDGVEYEYYGRVNSIDSKGTILKDRHLIGRPYYFSKDLVKSVDFIKRLDEKVKLTLEEIREQAVTSIRQRYEYLEKELNNWNNSSWNKVYPAPNYYNPKSIKNYYYVNVLLANMFYSDGSNIAKPNPVFEELGIKWVE